MMRSRTFALLALLGVVVTPTTQVLAHGIWFAERGVQLALIFGMSR